MLHKCHYSKRLIPIYWCSFGQEACLQNLICQMFPFLFFFYFIGERRDQKILEKLRAERQAKIDELKEKTNYYTTQQLIQVLVFS